jgi:c-di-GMP phosphodiesterase
MIQLQSLDLGNSEPGYLDETSMNDSIEDIASIISHELRTPLTAIQGLLGLLQMGALGSLSEEGQSLLTIAINNANRLTRLANAIDHDPVLPMTILSTIDIEQLKLENDLHQAFKHQEFQLHYQPIVSIELNQIIGFEALARWHHRQRGIISPTVFIPLTEKTGLIHALGMWTLEQACRQLYIWQQQFPGNMPLTMNVNVSALQFLQPTLVQQVQHILQRTGIAPNSLKFEITESALFENGDRHLVVLSELKNLGIQLYIDDFGTGYSSLGRLQDLPIDALKIDRSFIQGKNWAISETIILLAEKLGLEVIAEGVETVEEAVSLMNLGCKKMQGHFFSEASTGEAVSTLLAKSLNVAPIHSL